MYPFPLGFLGTHGAGGLAIFGTSFPMPVTHAVRVGDVLKRCPIWIHPDATLITFAFRNKAPTGSYTPADFSTDVAIHTSSPGAAGKVTGAPATATVNVPGDDSWSSEVSAAGIARGADGKLVVSYGIPNGTDVFYNGQSHHGWYYDATLDPTVTSAPTNTAIEGHLWVRVTYRVPWATTRVVLAHDSILPGATNGSDAQIRATGFEDGAWYQLMISQSICVCFNGQQGAKMETFADPVTNPRIWEVPASFTGRSGARLVHGIGTNDLPDGAAAMQTRATAVVDYARSLGMTSIWAWTLAPAVSYVANNADRVTYNTWLRTMPAALDLDFLADVDLWDAYPWDRTILPDYVTPPYSWTYDGTHRNPAGQARDASVFDGSIAPYATSSSIWLHSELPQNNVGLAREVGVGFDSFRNGTINGVWFYKHATEGGAHTIRAWTTAGVAIASKLVSGETASGWQYMAFDSPIAYTAFTVIILSVNMNSTVVYNSAAPLTFPLYVNNLRVLTNTQAYTLNGSSVGGGYPGGTFIGAVLGAFPSPVAASGESYFVDVDFTAT